jgi:hypothetical protein
LRFRARALLPLRGHELFDIRFGDDVDGRDGLAIKPIGGSARNPPHILYSSSIWAIFLPLISA